MFAVRLFSINSGNVNRQLTGAVLGENLFI